MFFSLLAFVMYLLRQYSYFTMNKNKHSYYYEVAEVPSLEQRGNLQEPICITWQTQMCAICSRIPSRKGSLPGSEDGGWLVVSGG